MRDQGNKIASANNEAVLKLSSTGLAVSFAIMRFLGATAAALNALQAAWVFWLLSTICLIASFWFAMSTVTQAGQWTTVARCDRC